MADTKTILELNDGVPITNPSNGFIYIVVDGEDNFIAVDDFVKGILSPHAEIVNVPAGSNYDIPNPFTLPKIPRLVKLINEDGTISLTPSINQETGVMTVYSLVAVNNMILTVLGW